MQSTLRISANKNKLRNYIYQENYTECKQWLIIVANI